MCTSFIALSINGYFPRAGCYQCVTKMSQEVDVTPIIPQGAGELHLPYCTLQTEMVEAYHTQQANDVSLQEIEI